MTRENKGAGKGDDQWRGVLDHDAGYGRRRGPRDRKFDSTIVCEFPCEQGVSVSRVGREKTLDHFTRTRGNLIETFHGWNVMPEVSKSAGRGAETWRSDRDSSRRQIVEWIPSNQPTVRFSIGLGMCWRKSAIVAAGSDLGWFNNFSSNLSFFQYVFKTKLRDCLL